MSIIEELSTSKGRRSKEINKELARSIAAKTDTNHSEILIPKFTGDFI